MAIETDSPTNKNVADSTPPVVNRFVYGAFMWCMGGVAIIYGIRLWHDWPIHPSFLPLIGAVFSGILAFTLVMSFRIHEGPIDFQLGSVKMKGAAGPIIMWCICFLTISYGLYLLGLGDATKATPPANYNSCSVLQIMTGKCVSKNQDASKSAVHSPTNAEGKEVESKGSKESGVKKE